MEKKNAEELLKIDFSKYEKLMLDRVIIKIKNAKVVVKKDEYLDVCIEVLIDNECIVRSFYNKYTRVKIREIDHECISISKEEIA